MVELTELVEMQREIRQTRYALSDFTMPARSGFRAHLGRRRKGCCNGYLMVVIQRLVRGMESIVRPKNKRDGTFEYTISAGMFCGPRTFAAKKGK